MTEKTIEVTANLESRLAAMFVQTAGRFACDIRLKIGSRVINAKSIMGVISLGILDGSRVTIVAEGEDETDAVDELARFLRGGR